MALRGQFLFVGGKGGDLGWTESAVEAFDAAERDARDWGY